MSEKGEGKTLGKSLVAGVLAILSTVYLLNPGAGFIEIIPDNLPFVGNFDEAAAAALLLGCLTYFGLDLRRLFGGAKGGGNGEKSAPGRVVEGE